MADSNRLASAPSLSFAFFSSRPYLTRLTVGLAAGTSWPRDPLLRGSCLYD
jgi:hypothetical protein